MAGSTTNLGLIKPLGSEKIRIAQINQNSDTLDAAIGAVGSTSLQAQVSAVEDGLAIVANGDSHVAITAGQFVYVRNNTHNLAEGLYVASANVSANASITSSNMTADASGGLNALNNNIATKTPFVYDTAGNPASADNLAEGIFFGVLSAATSPDGTANWWYVITMPRTTGIQIAWKINGDRMYIRPRVSSAWGSWVPYVNSSDLKRISISGWGSFYTVGTKIALNTDASNFQFFEVVVGVQATGTIGQRQLVAVPPVGQWILIDVSTANSPGQYMELCLNSARELEITKVTSGVGSNNAIRQVYGMF